MAGYSETPLVKKLGLKENFRVKIINQPENYFDLLSDLPEGIKIIKSKSKEINFIHVFSKDANELNKLIPELKTELVSNGMIWISWPKKSSKIETDITEDTIRAIAFKNGLVDIKVCAIDETWSGLKLVIRVKNRK
jgi:exosome complex RNA-binding protein Rrp4